MPTNFRYFHPDKYLSPVDHGDVCSGCIDCSDIKIFSTVELLRAYRCDYKTKRPMLPSVQCNKTAKYVKDVGIDADKEHRRDICVCKDHESDDVVANFYVSEFHG